jgi:hypothetical protein
MALRITIDVFSGRPNPSFIVEGDEEREILARSAPARSAGRKARAVPLNRLPTSILGYRGLRIEPLAKPGARRAATPQRELRIAGGLAFGPRGGLPTADPRVEDFVCGTTGPPRLGGLGPQFPGILLEEIWRFRHLLERYPWRPIPWPIRPRCLCAPLWEPSWWNDAGQVQWNNNCYNYATNYRSDSYAQPGLANGAMYTSITCSAVSAGAIADALIDAPSANNRCPREGHLVALVVGPGFDFHWYRKGRNGYWTHKPGGTQATQLDNSGNLISDPRTADRDGYTHFCGFMVVMHGHVKIH